MGTDDALKGSHTDKHGDEIVGYVNPDGSGEGNWSQPVQPEAPTPDSFRDLFSEHSRDELIDVLYAQTEAANAAEARAASQERPQPCRRCGRMLDPETGECPGEYIADGRHAAQERPPYWVPCRGRRAPEPAGRPMSNQPAQVRQIALEAAQMASEFATVMDRLTDALASPERSPMAAPSHATQVIDVERLRDAIENVAGKRPRWQSELDAVDVVAEYARLSRSVASPEDE